MTEKSRKDRTSEDQGDGMDGDIRCAQAKGQVRCHGGEERVVTVHEGQCSGDSGPLSVRVPSHHGSCEHGVSSALAAQVLGARFTSQGCGTNICKSVWLKVPQ